ncbi:MAG: 50S ribosomal protein L5 [Puniceicoccales bacterium]
MSKPKLQTVYQETILPDLIKEKGYKNALQAARLTKVVINTGVSASLDKAAVEEAARDVSLIAGQKAVITRARKSISNFKLREGMPIGAKVTLRGARMWEFVYRCLNIALPNIRDFRGVPNKLDGSGNYTLGVTDHTIFPEISTDGNRRNMGMDITFVTSATSDADGHDLLRRLGMPFRKNQSAESDAQAA